MKVYYSMGPADDGGFLEDGVTALGPDETWASVAARLGERHNLTLSGVGRPSDREVVAYLLTVDNHYVLLAMGW